MTLITPGELAGHLDDPAWVIVDCRFALNDPGQGAREYGAGHIPGAIYAHLDHDLSGPVVPGQTGRHPLPAVEAAAATFSRWGITDGITVVAYDGDNSMIAGRLWWLLRWLGHEAVAVLDGGWVSWQRAGLPETTEPPSPTARHFKPRAHDELIADAAAVLRLRQDSSARLVDSRAADRYRGENETIDPVGGHIPGALSGPFAENLNRDGTFRSPDELRARFTRLLGDTSAEKVVFYCGSGVSAANNLLALAHAGLGEARLYPGSWSEWITDPSRPVARGADRE